MEQAWRASSGSAIYWDRTDTLWYAPPRPGANALKPRITYQDAIELTLRESVTLVSVLHNVGSGVCALQTLFSAFLRRAT